MHEATSSNKDILWNELDQIVSIDVAIISAMRRFLPEINKTISGPKIKLNKQNMFDLVARDEIDTKTPPSNLKEILKKIARMECIT